MAGLWERLWERLWESWGGKSTLDFTLLEHTHTHTPARDPPRLPNCLAPPSLGLPCSSRLCVDYDLETIFLRNQRPASAPWVLFVPELRRIAIDFAAQNVLRSSSVGSLP
eukprot:2269697-Rhodomonas_salina.1